MRIERVYGLPPQREKHTVYEKHSSIELSDEEILEKLQKKTICCMVDDFIEKKEEPLEEKKSKTIKRKLKKANSKSK